MTDKVMYTSEHIDGILTNHIKLRAALRKKGQLQLGQPVHALAGNMSAAAQKDEAKEDKAAERETKKTEHADKMEIERQKLQIARTKKPLPEHEGYCMKCQKKVTVTTEGKYRHKNGVQGIFGPCPNCSSEVHRMVGKTAAAPTKSKAAK